MTARPSLLTRFFSRYSEPIGFVGLFLLVVGLLALSTQRTSRATNAVLSCENDLAEQIREHREVTTADLDAIEDECSALRRNR